MIVYSPYYREAYLMKRKMTRALPDDESVNRDSGAVEEIRTSESEHHENEVYRC